MSRINRRDFLKAIGLTGTVTAASACSWDDNRYLTPVESLLPYVVKEEAVTPGTPTFYATSVTTGPDAHPVAGRHREGRVVNVGANTAAPWDAAVPAAALLALQRHYSPDRRHGPASRSGDSWSDVTWGEGLAQVAAAASAGSLGYIGPYRSGALARLIGDLTGGNAVHWDPIGYAAEADAAQRLFGARFLPGYDLSQAHYVLSFGAPFLGGWRGARPASQYARARNPNDGGFVARFAFVGSHLDQTAANADDWIGVAPGTEHLAALAIARLVADKNGTLASLGPWLGDVDAAALGAAAGLDAAVLDGIAEALSSQVSVTLPGGTAGATENGVDLALATYLINLAAGSAGRTFGGGRTYNAPVHGVADLDALLAKVASGQIKVLLVDDVDPVGALPGGDAIGERLAAAELLVSLNSFPDATSNLAHLILPVNDAFEDWGDEEVETGLTIVRQPTMVPLNDTRGLGDVLLTLGGQFGDTPDQLAWDEAWADIVADREERLAAGADLTDQEPIPSRPIGLGAPDFQTYLKAHFEQAWFPASGAPAFDRWWHETLAKGYAENPARTGLTPLGVVAPDAPPSTAPTVLAGAGDYALHIYAHPFRRGGRFANEPWAQEVPDPMTGQCWDSWVEIHPDTAAALGVVDNDLVQVQTDSGTIEVGVEVYPGIRPDVIAVALGQGHGAKGRYAEVFGKNAAALIAAGARAGSSVAWQSAKASVQKTGHSANLTGTIGGDAQEGRDLAAVVPAQELARVGDAASDHPGELTGIHHLPRDERLGDRGKLDFYPVPEHPSYRWAMTIDTNACNGCGICVIACYAENNLAVVGKELVKRGRNMNWLRINRYWETKPDGTPEARFLPMMCQQCGHAPCESVCPVLATYHSLEGLNAMVYNRCVGTRYCANNCPYQVRRFNYHSYMWPEPFNLQLNPDVTTRVAGVMEKCTFCVQRIREVKGVYRDAGFDNKVPSDAIEQLPACAESCPSQAITFGNQNEEGAVVNASRKSARSYQVLEELRTFPAVNYLGRASFHAELAHHDTGHDAPPHGEGETAPAGH